MQIVFKGSLLASHSRCLALICATLLQTVTLTRRLSTERIDPRTIETIPASRLIPLVKGNGEFRPAGVAAVIRRVIGKSVTRVMKQDILESSGLLQVCARHKSGREAAVHAMNSLFQRKETDVVLQVDASDACNTLCPGLAILCNQYLPSRSTTICNGG